MCPSLHLMRDRVVSLHMHICDPQRWDSLSSLNHAGLSRMHLMHGTGYPHVIDTQAYELPSEYLAWGAVCMVGDHKQDYLLCWWWGDEPIQNPEEVDLEQTVARVEYCRTSIPFCNYREQYRSYFPQLTHQLLDKSLLAVVSPSNNKCRWEDWFGRLWDEDIFCVNAILSHLKYLYQFNI